MKLFRLIAVAMLAFAGYSHAAAGGASGIQAFANNTFLGYGFSYSVTWNSPIDFQVNSYNYTLEQDVGSGTIGIINAYVEIVPTTFASDLTQLESQFTVSFSFINLATGVVGLPPAFYSPTGGLENSTSYDISRLHDGCFIPDPAVEVRFSSSKCTITRALNGSNALPDGSMVARVDGSATLISQAGNYLKASDDPACASFSCMTPGHDQLRTAGIRLSAGAAVVMVPEPGSLHLLALGLVAIGALTIYRRGQSALS